MSTLSDVLMNLLDEIMPQQVPQTTMASFADNDCGMYNECGCGGSCGTSCSGGCDDSCYGGCYYKCS